MGRRSLVMLGALLLAAGLVAACGPPAAPPAPAPYLDAVYTTSVTPKASPVTWGAAPPLDDSYGGTIYPGTTIEQQDPRPPRDANGNEPLRLWIAQPTSGPVSARPAIIWLHGGGFAKGLDSMWGLANGVGNNYAARGYVSISVEYRSDTTVIGTGTATQNPTSLCQWVQDHVNGDDPVWVARYQQCARDVLAAQYDAQGALRWVRQHFLDLGINPNKIAVGGFSAGAVTALNVAYRGDDTGGVVYFPGDDRTTTSSAAQAVLSASGYEPDFTAIGPGDAPISAIHAKNDQAAPYSFMAQTALTARSQGLVAELTSYCSENKHADVLYNAYKTATDQQWTTFLARELKLYSGMRAPSADPVCP